MNIKPTRAELRAWRAKGLIPADAVPAKRPKYGNRKTEADGRTFDSAKEARRYGELKALAAAGAITDLRLQVRFDLTANGKRVATYTADFQYREDGKLVVEDVKSAATRKNATYRLKRRLMLACHGITIREV